MTPDLSIKDNFGIPWLFRNFSIAIIGDLILDEYLHGHVERISPEAPVPVHKIQKTHWVLGGAANVASNIQRCGGQAHVFGVVGEDESGRVFLDLLNQEKIQTYGVLKVSDRPTIKKTRVMAQGQQMIRIDWEKSNPIHSNDQKKILDILSQLNPDAYLISDYGKGSLPKELVKSIIALGCKHQKPIIVDPKGVDYHFYRGCTLITPNKKEATLALGLEDSESLSGEFLGQKLQEVYGLKHVLVTMGAQGMVWVPSSEIQDKKSEHLRTRARQVFDVSGAGDTVAALMTLGMAANLSISQSMQWANKGAGLVVEKIGTQPVSWQELLFEMNHDHKHISIEDLMLVLDKNKKKIVFTNGCFDVFHAGHARYLKEAKKLGDLLIVGINSDDSVSKLKGPSRPINSLALRAEVLESLESVDYIVSFSEETPIDLIRLIKPQVLVKGGDYKPEDIVGYQDVLSWGGQVKTISLVPQLSSSIILEKLKN